MMAPATSASALTSRARRPQLTMTNISYDAHEYQEHGRTVERVKTERETRQKREDRSTAVRAKGQRQQVEIERRQERFQCRRKNQQFVEREQPAAGRERAGNPRGSRSEPVPRGQREETNGRGAEQDLREARNLERAAANFHEQRKDVDVQGREEKRLRRPAEEAGGIGQQPVARGGLPREMEVVGAVEVTRRHEQRVMPEAEQDRELDREDGDQGAESKRDVRSPGLRAGRASDVAEALLSRHPTGRRS